MGKHTLHEAVLAVLRQHLDADGVSAGFITSQVDHSRPTVNRALVELVNNGSLVRSGGGRSVVYRLSVEESTRLSPSVGDPVEELRPTSSDTALKPLVWSKSSLALKTHLSQSLGSRTPVSYQRSFVENYEPNMSSLLPKKLAQELWDKGKSKTTLPAGTYARKVLEQLLIDLSWSSSRLEGNKKSILDTKELFEKGHSGNADLDTVMLLNHKDAIEFLVECVPNEGITVPIIRNLQSILMNALLSNSAELGKIRNTLVSIEGTVYQPTQVPALLEQMLELIVQKGRLINNPLESAFFFWVNLAYLQPFVDGNKRTSRLACNMPLLLANCTPLSFLNVERNDYALAMLGIYEKLDTSIAVDLFEHTYNRSVLAYAAARESLGEPPAFRIKYREQLSEVISQVVYFGQTLSDLTLPANVEPADSSLFWAMVKEDLASLEIFNCSRFRLPVSATRAWIEKGRPA